VTQQQLADAIGLSRPSLTNIEKGAQKILIHTVYELATELGVDVSTLLPSRVRASALDKIEASQRELISKALSNITERIGT
jgi:transcriptional regulator with XRE-family HTH domain